MPVAAIDFGTYSSGIVWGPNDDGIINDFHYNNKALNGGYAKTRTAFLVSKSLLEKIDSLSDDEIRLSDHEDENGNTNVWIGDISREKYLDTKRSKDEDANWVYFDRFKMCLYNRDSVVIGSDKKEYNLEKIITLFLRCLKISFLKKIAEFHHDFVKWGFVISNDLYENEKCILKSAAFNALKGNVLFISDTEALAVASFFYGILQSTFENAQKKCMYFYSDEGEQKICIYNEEINIREKRIRLNNLLFHECKIDYDILIANKFWELLAEKLAEKEECFGHPFSIFIKSFKIENVAGWHQMEQQWLTIKHNPSSSDKIYFEFPRTYSNWLKENHQVAFNAFEDEFGCTIVFSRKEIEEKVFKPVVDEIIAAAQEAAAQSASKLDYIFFAGGLCALPYLPNALRDSFEKSHPSANMLFEHYSDYATALPGGSIMIGTALILVFKSFYSLYQSVYDNARSHATVPCCLFPQSVNSK